jgi:hypothetical protein
MSTCSFRQRTTPRIGGGSRTDVSTGWFPYTLRTRQTENDDRTLVPTIGGPCSNDRTMGAIMRRQPPFREVEIDRPCIEIIAIVPFWRRAP